MFKVGDSELLRTNELLDAANIGKLRQRWNGPFTVTACPSPNTYTLALLRRMRCSPMVNVYRLKPFSALAGASPAPGPVPNAGQQGEHEVELLLNSKLVRGVTRYLVRWRGHTSADDSCLRLEELAHCQEKVAEYNTVAPCRRATRRAARTALPAAVPPTAPAQARVPHGARRVSRRGPDRGPGGDGARRIGCALSLAGLPLCPRHRGPPQQGRWLLARPGKSSPAGRDSDAADLLSGLLSAVCMKLVNVPWILGAEHVQPCSG